LTSDVEKIDESVHREYSVSISFGILF
jgi:hypothetical protein